MITIINISVAQYILLSTLHASTGRCHYISIISLLPIVLLHHTLHILPLFLEYHQYISSSLCNLLRPITQLLLTYVQSLLQRCQCRIPLTEHHPTYTNLVEGCAAINVVLAEFLALTYECEVVEGYSLEELAFVGFFLAAAEIGGCRSLFFRSLGVSSLLG